MSKLAILTTDNLEDFFVYDELTYPHLQQLGWDVTEVSWHQSGVDWDQFDAVIIRSTWDYQDDPQGFLTCLEQIDGSSAVLLNSLETVKWNISKNYLQDLEQAGVLIVPTLWHEHYGPSVLTGAFAHFNCAELVIKPRISANADYTYRISQEQADTFEDILVEVFQSRPFMIQPFMKAIVEEGEYSLFYFEGEYSHSILKVPKSADFRVQEEHGGRLLVHHADPQQKRISEQVLAAIPELPLYARIDLVRYQDSYALMEVELIEPSLYFNLDNDSPQRFAQAVQRHMASITSR